MKRKPLLIIGAVFLIVLSAFVYVRHRNWAMLMDKVLTNAYNQMQEISGRIDDRWLGTAVRDRTMKKLLSDSKIPNNEAKSITHTFLMHIEKRGAYAMPVYVRRAYVRGRLIWVIGYVWEWKGLVDTMRQGLGHIAVVCIDSRPPYGILGKRSCD